MVKLGCAFVGAVQNCNLMTVDAHEIGCGVMVTRGKNILQSGVKNRLRVLSGHGLTL